MQLAIDDDEFHAHATAVVFVTLQRMIYERSIVDFLHFVSVVV